MKSHDQVREQIAAAYTRAVGSGSGCCSAGCCETSVPTDTAQSLGYDAQELAQIPADAVQNSFGCGNPLAVADVQAGETVLDLGCGAGIDLLLAAPRVGEQGKVIGVDMTDEMIRRARENVAAAGFENVEVRQGLIEQLPVEDGSVDLVISNCVLNLSPDKPRVFAEIARVLKPGGRIRVSDMVAEGLPDWVRQSPALVASCVGGAVSEADYLDGLRAAGLAKVAVQERLDYELPQLEELISELPQAAEGISAAELLQKMTLAPEASVASILVTAVKPAG